MANSHDPDSWAAHTWFRRSRHIEIFRCWLHLVSFDICAIIFEVFQLMHGAIVDEEIRVRFQCRYVCSQRWWIFGMKCVFTHSEFRPSFLTMKIWISKQSQPPFLHLFFFAVRFMNGAAHRRYSFISVNARQILHAWFAPICSVGKFDVDRGAFFNVSVKQMDILIIIFIFFFYFAADGLFIHGMRS